LTLSSAREQFAIPADYIREITEYAAITQIPMMPMFILSVINLRDAVVPAIDLAARFGGELTPETRRTCIVMAELPAADHLQQLGLLVDEVNEVLDVSEHQLEPRPAFGACIRPDFIRNILKHKSKFICVLDIAQVLSLEELAELVGTNPTMD